MLQMQLHILALHQVMQPETRPTRKTVRDFALRARLHFTSNVIQMRQHKHAHTQHTLAYLPKDMKKIYGLCFGSAAN